MQPLESLKENLLNLTHEQRLEKLKEIREDRKVSKYAETVKKKRSQDKAAKLGKQLADMTPEEKAEFVKLLGGGNEN